MKNLSVFGQNIVKKMPILVVTAILLSGFFVANSAEAAATVSPVGNGANISIDTSAQAISPTWKSLGAFSFSVENGDIGIGTHTIMLPDGWEFNTGSDINIIPGNDIVLGSNSVTPDSTSFTFEVISESTYSGPIMFFNLQVRPTGITPGTGNMTYSGAGVVGIDGSTNFGTLSTIAGTVTQVAFMTQPSVSTIYGSSFAQQPVVITQDQFGNSSTNGLGSGKTVALSLIPSTGAIVGTNNISIDSGTATFTDLTVDEIGSKTFTATVTGLTPATSDSFEITSKALTATPVISNKTYDGNTTATVTDLTLNGFVDGDEVSPSATTPDATFTDPNVANGITVTVTEAVTLNGDDAGNYTLTTPITGTADIIEKEITVTPDAEQTKIYGDADPTLTYTNTVLVEGDAFSGLLGRDTGEDVDSYTFSLGTLDLGSNYALTLGASDPFVITARPLTITATPNTKVYDGNVSSVAVPIITSGSLVEGDEENFVQVYSNANVGTGKWLTPSGTAGENEGNNYSYTFSPSYITGGVITEKELTIFGLSAADKVYDGNTEAVVSGTPSLDGVVGSDDVSLSGGASGSFDDLNVGERTVNVSGFSLAGANSGNYTLTMPELNANITQLGITGSFTTDNKIYDGNTLAVILSQSLSGVLLVDDGNVILSGGGANFADKDVGDDVAVNASEMVLSGSASGNYNLIGVNSTTADITAKNITVDVTISNKVYDGTTTATITDITSEGITDGDVVTFSGGTAVFADAEAGNNKEVNVTGIVGGGADIGNYSYNSSVTATGNILPVPSAVYVDDNWADTTEWTDPDGDGSANYFGYDAFATIQNAIGAVAEGGIVNVAAGLYTEDLTISKQIDLIGAGKSITKIKGIANVAVADWPLAVPNIDIQADGVKVHGFTIEGSDYESGKYVSGTVITGENIEIYNNNFVTTRADNTDELGQAITTYSKTAIPTADISGLNIHNNTFSGSGSVGTEAIYINPHVGSGTVTINANEFSGSIFVGITVESGDINITGNDIDSTVVGKGFYGIRFMDTSYVANYSGIVVSDNTIQNFQKGVRVGNGGDGTSVLTASISSNTIIGNDTGIWARKGSALTVDDNNLAGNTIGIQNDITTDVNAVHNWWGTAVESTIDGNVSDHVNYDLYWVNSTMTILSDASIDAVYVDGSYSDGSADTHIFGYDAFATIQEGVDVVDEEGTVNIAAGTYNESVTVDKDITIAGVGETTVVTPSIDQDGFTITADGVMIQNLKITSSNSAPASTDPDYNVAPANKAISVEEADDLEINNVTVETTGNKAMGIWVGNIGYGNSNNLSIIDSTIIINNESTGIYAEGGTTAQTGWSITGNTITANLGNPLELYDVTDSTVSGNTLTTSASGGSNVMWFAELSDLSNLVFTNNILDGSSGSQVAIGTDFRDYGPFADSPAKSITTITITGNTFDDWGSRALRLGKVGIGTITEVTVSGNKFLIDEQSQIISNTDDTAEVNAEDNWWGFSSGPTPISVVVGDVDYRPWCTEDTCTSTDTTVPTVTISSSESSPTDASPIPVIITFSETVTDLIADEIVVTNGTKGDLTGSGTTYGIGVTPSGDGAVTVNIAADVAWDLAGNYNTVATEFSITSDLTVPTLSSVSIASDNANTAFAKVGDEVTLTFTSSEVIGTPTVTIGGNTAAVSGSDTSWSATYTMVEGDTEGVIAFTIDFADVAGNDGTTVAEVTDGGGSVTFDETAPVLAEVTPVADPTNDITPSYVFSSDEAGTISYGGSCESADTSAGSGDNSITFNELAEGIYNDCTIKVTDATGNESSSLTVSSFTVDTTAPTITSKTPKVDAIGIDTFADITVVFDEDVVIGTSNVVLKEADGSPTITLASEDITFNSTTHTATINPSVTLENNTKYNIALSNIKDTAGNDLADINWDFTTATSYAISLASGWNLISLPVTPTNWTSISGVLNSVNSQVASVWTYNAVDREWYSYSNDGVDNDSISSMEAGKGYWAKMNSTGSLTGSGTLYEQLIPAGDAPSGDLPQVQLGTGWNMIGYYQLPGNTTSPVADALSVLGASGTSWSTSHLMSFANGTLDPETTITTMTPGKGYWIFMNEAKEYTFGI